MAKCENVQDRIKVFENINESHELEPLNKSRLVNDTSTHKHKCNFKWIDWFKTSRFAGLPFALLFGCYFYYLVTFLILSGVDDLELLDMKDPFAQGSSEDRQIYEVECIRQAYANDNDSGNITIRSPFGVDQEKM